MSDNWRVENSSRVCWIKMKAALRPMVTCEYSRLLSLLVGDTRRIRRLANALSRLLAERAVSDLRPPPRPCLGYFSSFRVTKQFPKSINLDTRVSVLICHWVCSLGTQKLATKKRKRPGPHRQTQVSFVQRLGFTVFLAEWLWNRR